MQEEGGSSGNVSAEAKPQRGNQEREPHSQMLCRCSWIQTQTCWCAWSASALTAPSLRRERGGWRRRKQDKSPSTAPPASSIHLSLPSPKQNYEGLKEFMSKERSVRVVMAGLLLFDALRGHIFLYRFLPWPCELERLPLLFY